MSEQLSLFGESPPDEVYEDVDGKGPYGPLALPPAHPIVILRWDMELGMVTSEWPELKLTGSFVSWLVALDVVLQNNPHISVRVRI